MSSRNVHNEQHFVGPFVVQWKVIGLRIGRVPNHIGKIKDFEWIVVIEMCYALKTNIEKM